ncbi:MAG: heme o synthase [Pirellulaceae bacterium]
MSTTTVTAPRDRMGWLARISDYVELSKPRIAFLVLITVAVAYWMACWGQPDLLLLGQLLAGTLLVACSASSLNQWLERRRDALMERTANRPLPSARMSAIEAVGFAVITLVLGASILLRAVGWQPLAWAVLTWILYVAAYTPLKSRTSLNTAVGAVGGAMPVFIGWSAAGGVYDLRVASLYLILFLWQFPHFMAIAWMYRKQYARAGMKMLPVVDPTGRRTGLNVLFAALVLIPVSLVPAAFLPGINAALYAVAVLALGLLQLAFACAFVVRLNDLTARRLLRVTLVYLPTLLLLLVVIPWK